MKLNHLGMTRSSGEPASEEWTCEHLVTEDFGTEEVIHLAVWSETERKTVWYVMRANPDGTLKVAYRRTGGRERELVIGQKEWAEMEDGRHTCGESGSEA